MPPDATWTEQERDDWSERWRREEMEPLPPPIDIDDLSDGHNDWPISPGGA